MVAERRELILDAARDLFAAEGYLGVTMDRVAAAIEYAKGTVYLQFGSKEDMLLALLARTRSDLAARLALATGGEERPRERLYGLPAALDEHVETAPWYLPLSALAAEPSIETKGADATRQDLRAATFRCLRPVHDLVKRAVAAGDLALPAWCRPESLGFALWSFLHGGLMLGRPLIRDAEGLASLALNTRGHLFLALLDGHGWIPLSHDHQPLQAYLARRQLLAEASRA